MSMQHDLQNVFAGFSHPREISFFGHTFLDSQIELLVVPDATKDVRCGTTECHFLAHLKWVDRSAAGSGQKLLLYSQCLPASCPSLLHDQPLCLPAGS